ncbi:unnamed protein product, partial [Arctia plantaginis]
MKWLCPVIIFNIIAFKIIAGDEIESDVTTQHDNDRMNNRNYSKNWAQVIEYRQDSHSKRNLYSTWGRWSECRGGSKTRRRHCLHRQICGDSLRIEIARCIDSYPAQLNKPSVVRKETKFVIPQLRQLDSEDVQKRFRGFSQWSSWTICSKRCITVRRRNCLKRAICGRQVVRQSAYCYMEGSYCHQWIRGKMQRRKNPEYTLVESNPMSPPAPAIHPEDSRASSPSPVCGKLGRYRGSPSAKMRQRMRDMVRIIGGRPAPPGKWPWQVAVLNRYK